MSKVYDNVFEKDFVLAKFISYIDKALLHKRIDYLKHQKHLSEKEYYIEYEEWELLSDEDYNVHSSFISEEKLEEIFEDKYISKAFSKLTALQQKIMYWNIVDGLPMSAISRILSVSLKSVEKAKSRALKNLKKYLEEFENDKEN